MTRQVAIPEPLPETNAALHVHRRHMKLHHHVVEMLMNGAYAKLRPLLNGTNNLDPDDGGDTVHGAVFIDRTVAAQTLQAIADKAGNEIVATASLKALDHALHIATRQIRDANGNRIDRKSRKLIAKRNQNAGSESPVTDNG